MPQVLSAVKALIEKDGKFLVVKMTVIDKELWDLPGGKVEFGESPYETLHREVKEETNLEVEINKTLGMFWFFRKKDGHQVVCNTFLCKPKHDNIDLTKNVTKESINEFRWVTKEEFLSNNFEVSHESLKELISLNYDKRQ